MGLLDSLFPSTETDPSSGTSPADMQTLALGKALQQIQEVGRQRTAGPMGSIAQNLMPLFGALVQAKAAQAQAVQKGQQDRLNQLLTLAKIGELGRQGGGEGPRTAEQGAVQAQLKGEPTDPWTQLQEKLHPQKPAKQDLSANAVTLGAMQGDPTMQALKGQNEQDAQQKAAYHAQLVAQNQDALLNLRNQAQENRRRQTVVDGKSGYTVIDPNTEQRIIGANQGAIEDQGLVPLSRQQTAQFNSTKISLSMLDELETLVKVVLPPKDESLLGRANSLFSIQSQNLLGTSDEVTKFKNVAKFLKPNIVQSLQANNKIPVVDIQSLSEPATTSDSREAALARIEQARGWLQDTHGLLLGNAQMPGAGGGAADQGATLVGGLIEQAKQQGKDPNSPEVRAEIQKKYDIYQKANPGTPGLSMDMAP